MSKKEKISVFIGDRLICTKTVKIPRDKDGRKIILEMKPNSFIQCDGHGSLIVSAGK